MAAARILVVDDSVVVRKLLTSTLSQDSDLEVLGTASDGQIALAKIEQLHPDLVTLDVEMPVMNGLETLARIRKLYPKLPVIMFSTLTEHGAGATLDALALGASDYATKPSTGGGPEQAVDAIRRELIPKIKALCGIAVLRLKSIVPRSSATRPKSANRKIEVVAIGTSTGGPNALAEVLPRIPKDFPVPIVVVQHMPPIFTRLLAERLAGRSAISIEEGSTGVALTAGHSWIAPGNFHMTVKRLGASRHLELNQNPPENSCRPAVDVLFRSVATAYGANVLAVVMTGMGADGVNGTQHIRDAGGEVIIQDEASSVVWGMPGLVYAAGNADAVYPLGQLASQITRRVVESRAPHSPMPSNRPRTAEPETA